MLRLRTYFVTACWLLIACSSCQPSKKNHQARLYLQGIDSELVKTVNIPETVIQKGELLSISVFSDNMEATAIYNQVQTSAGAIANSSTDASNTGGGRGYQVDVQGNIMFHGLGLVHVQGLTKPQLIQLLTQKLDTVLKNPYVEIRFLNKRVTMLGEVAKPGVLNIPEERLTILDALALSGDLTPYARNDNMMVIREENGKRTVGRLNIKDPAIYKSPYFYLQEGDFVYIEPVRKKPIGTDAVLLRNIAVASSLVSLFAILYSILTN